MLSLIKSILSGRNYKIYTRPYELNIVGVRSNSVTPNKFDDEIHVFFKTSPMAWDYYIFHATTDPGTYWLNNPMMTQGTAILCQGQYENCFALGLHKGQYTALVQVKPVTVIRDYNRDSILDFYNGTKDYGNHGINIHRALVNGITKSVDKFSAGCQVFENINEFDKFIYMCNIHKQRYGNSFTYSLIDLRSIQRETIKRIGVCSSLIAAGAATYLYLKN